MIVRDEADKIERCLASLAAHVDYAVIVDTGSVDGTPEVIKAELTRLGLAGEVHHREWTDFATARQQALGLARGHCDYILIADADWTMEADPKAFEGLTSNWYSYRIDNAQTTHYNERLLKDHPDLAWRWIYPVHEQPYAPSSGRPHILPDMRMIAHSVGAVKTKRWQKDIELLEAFLREHPDDGHVLFHLANSYLADDKPVEAHRVYRRLLELPRSGSLDTERAYLALIRIAETTDNLGERLDLMRRAFHLAPARMEAALGIVAALRKAGKQKEAYSLTMRLLSAGAVRRPPRAVLDVSGWIYDYGILHQHAVMAAQTGDLIEAQRAFKALIAEPTFPEDKRRNAKTNLARISSALANAH